jgi:hypothetical protein
MTYPDPGPEWTLLERVAGAEPGSDEDAAAAVELARDDIDADELVTQAIRHTLAPALADFLIRHDLLGRLDPCVRVHIMGALQWNRHRTRAFAREALRVVEALTDAGVQAAGTKGIVCQALLYDSRGTRYFNDVDLMISPTDAATTTEVMRALGYTNEKRYDLQRDELVAVPRDVHLVYQLYPDHLEPFFRVTGDTADPVYKFDFSFSLTWYRSHWQIPMDEVLRERDRVAVLPPTDGTLPTLTGPYGFLFLVLHLFRDTWFYSAILDKDVRLSQVADVARFWRRLGRSQAAAITALVRRHDLGPVVAWVTHHVDAVFGTTMVADLELDAYADPRWLRSASGPDGSFLEWDGDMRHRLWRKGPPELVSAAEPPFGADARSVQEAAISG